MSKIKLAHLAVPTRPSPKPKKQRRPSSPPKRPALVTASPADGRRDGLAPRLPTRGSASARKTSRRAADRLRRAGTRAHPLEAESPTTSFYDRAGRLARRTGATFSRTPSPCRAASPSTRSSCGRRTASTRFPTWPGRRDGRWEGVATAPGAHPRAERGQSYFSPTARGCSRRSTGWARREGRRQPRERTAPASTTTGCPLGRATPTASTPGAATRTGRGRHPALIGRGTIIFCLQPLLHENLVGCRPRGRSFRRSLTNQNQQHTVERD